MSIATSVRVLDLRSVFGITARVTTPAAATHGAYVEMECTAEPGSSTIIHYHPGQLETYDVIEGVLEVFRDGTWRPLRAGQTLTIPAETVHAFRNNGQTPTRFLNRHEPALGFEAHLETVDRLVRVGKIRGTRDPRSLIYLSMSAAKHRPDVAVRPPQRLVNALAFIGRRLGYRLDP
jgi:quercetin dioxygenase-like cupin family protein